MKTNDYVLSTLASIAIDTLSGTESMETRNVGRSQRYDYETADGRGLNGTCLVRRFIARRVIT